MALIVAAFAFMGMGIGRGIWGKENVPSWVGIAFSVGCMWFFYFLLNSYFSARFQCLVWDKTAVGGMALHCEVSAAKLMRIQCMNTLWVILSLGLYRPFAAVRLAKFRLECVCASKLDSLDTVAVGIAQSRRGALGESAAELFEMDVGL
jgi:uncharacterized membrane protein YjgN (DUF898 family)